MLAYYRAHDSNTEKEGISRSLLDLGCGHGPVSRALAPHFSSVTAMDPSPGMVAQARQLTASPNITVRQGTAEDLGFLAASSVDLVVAGTAAHWFDFSRTWPELGRVVRKGGSIAFWAYNDSTLVGYPQLRSIMQRYCFGTGEVRPGMEALGRFWEERGKSVLMNLFAAIKPPEEEWEDVRRVVFKPDDSATCGVERAAEEALRLSKRLSLGEYAMYLRTMSAVHNWEAAHPEMRSRADGGEGDVIDAMIDDFLEAIPEWKASECKGEEVKVEAVWATVILMARRR